MVSFGDLNPIKAVQKVAEGAVRLGKEGLQELDEATEGLQEGVGDFLEDRLVDASEVGAKLKLPWGQWFEHPQLEAKERHELVQAARAQALRLPQLRPWGEAINAHHTNTPEELREAIAGDFDCFEVDVRVMKGFDGKPTPVAAHDQGSLGGVTLDEWFSIAGATGRYLKLDFKEPEALPAVLALAKKHGVAGDRLVFNLSANPKALEAVRQAFPTATLAIGAPADGARQEEIAALAKRLGPPVTFVMQRDDIDAGAVARLEAVGPISAWGERGSRAEREAIAQRLRELGVTGMIDLGLQGGP